MGEGGKDDETDGPTSLMIVGEDPRDGVRCLSVPDRKESFFGSSPFMSFGRSPSLGTTEKKQIVYYHMTIKKIFNNNIK